MFIQVMCECVVCGGLYLYFNGIPSLPPGFAEIPIKSALSGLLFKDAARDNDSRALAAAP